MNNTIIHGFDLVHWMMAIDATVENAQIDNAYFEFDTTKGEYAYIWMQELRIHLAQFIAHCDYYTYRGRDIYHTRIVYRHIAGPIFTAFPYNFIKELCNEIGVKNHREVYCKIHNKYIYKWDIKLFDTKSAKLESLKRHL